MTASARAVLGSALFLLVAPGTVAGLVPWWISRWEIRPPLLGLSFLPIAGVPLIAAGIGVLLDSFARFAIQGIGTPAPILPTRRLVVTGLYRYVRNPMYLGIVSAILGQGLLFGNERLLEYAVITWLVVHVFVLAYEEPTLRRSFGAEYRAYCSNVRRWVPRGRPWRGAAAQE